MSEENRSKINLELCPKGAGWAYVYLTVNGERHTFTISTVLGYEFNALLEGLYYMNPNVEDTLDSDFCPHCQIFDYIFRVGEMDGTTSYEVETLEEGYKKIGRNYGICVDAIPYKIEFTWMDEPGGTKWVIERPKNYEPVFDLKIHIETDSNGEEEKIDFKISYKEFCYAVAKAATEALKKHGLLGYHKSIFYADMNLRCLLRLKAYALDCEEEIAVKNYTETEGDISSLEAEFRLLMKDM